MPNTCGAPGPCSSIVSLLRSLPGPLKNFVGCLSDPLSLCRGVLLWGGPSWKDGAGGTQILACSGWWPCCVKRSCACKGLTTGFLVGWRRALIWSLYQFPWCRFSRRGPFQATNMMSLNVTWEGDTQWQAIVQCLHQTSTADISNLKGTDHSKK